MRTASTFFATIADGVYGLSYSVLSQTTQLCEKFSAVHLCNQLFSIHDRWHVGEARFWLLRVVYSVLGLQANGQDEMWDWV